MHFRLILFVLIRILDQFNIQGLPRDSGSARAKKVLDALNNDTKAIFLENIPDKVRYFRKSKGSHDPIGPLIIWGLISIL